MHARYSCPLVCIMAPSHPLASLASISPTDLIGHRLISVPLQELYGINEEKVYGDVLAQLNIGLQVRSGLIASLFSLASGEIAVVDALAVSGNLLPLVIRRFESAAAVNISVIHNSFKPLSPQALLFRDMVMGAIYKGVIWYIPISVGAMDITGWGFGYISVVWVTAAYGSALTAGHFWKRAPKVTKRALAPTLGTSPRLGVPSLRLWSVGRRDGPSLAQRG